MVDELVDMLLNFSGQANHCCCFLHIVNLVAKTLLKQFDVQKKDTESTLMMQKESFSNFLQESNWRRW